MARRKLEPVTPESVPDAPIPECSGDLWRALKQELPAIAAGLYDAQLDELEAMAVRHVPSAMFTIRERRAALSG